MTTITNITKLLSANDTGETGAHQAGICVPKNRAILSFFPTLDVKQLNPRVILKFRDDCGDLWDFAFIYYNNKFFEGTRNEYRLTRMTKYIQQAGLKSGDEVHLSRDAQGEYSVRHSKQSEKQSPRKYIQLGSGWKVVQI